MRTLRPRSGFAGPVEPPPAWIKPQLAKLVESAPDGTDWLHEIKFDGYRMHARLHARRVQILSAFSSRPAVVSASRWRRRRGWSSTPSRVGENDAVPSSAPAPDRVAVDDFVSPRGNRDAPTLSVANHNAICLLFRDHPEARSQRRHMFEAYRALVTQSQLTFVEIDCVENRIQIPACPLEAAGAARDCDAMDVITQILAINVRQQREIGILECDRVTRLGNPVMMVVQHIPAFAHAYHSHSDGSSQIASCGAVGAGAATAGLGV